MTSVRKMATSTVTLIAVCVGVYFLTRWCNTLPGDFFYRIKRFVYSISQFGTYNNIALRVSFWALLIGGALDTIYNNKRFLAVIWSFRIPLIFTATVAGWVFLSMNTGIDIRWFVGYYFIAMVICLWRTFKMLSRIHDSERQKIRLFIKGLAQRNIYSGSALDYHILVIARFILVILWAGVIVSTIIYFVQYKGMFGL